MEVLCLSKKLWLKEVDSMSSLPSSDNAGQISCILNSMINFHEIQMASQVFQLQKNIPTKEWPLKPDLFV